MLRFLQLILFSVKEHRMSRKRAYMLLTSSKHLDLQGDHQHGASSRLDGCLKLISFCRSEVDISQQVVALRLTQTGMSLITAP